MKRKNNKQTNGDIVIYQTSKKEIQIDVKLDKETIWLSLNQIAALFNTDKSGISRHINNIYKSNELVKSSTVAKIATVQNEGKRKVTRQIQYYNLDMVISVGYRVNSKIATRFRIWATKVLKEHIVKGYTINEKRLKETRGQLENLQKTITLLHKTSKKDLATDQAHEILSLLANYSKTLSTLEKFDKGDIKTVKGKKTGFILTYENCLEIIKELKRELLVKKEAGDLFGLERQGAFEGVVKNLYQTFDGKELYPTIEAKASHFLYFTIKDHPFSDGNKRIASFLFIFFLDKVHYLYKHDGERKINDNGLTALALLIAKSDPKDKEIMINIVQHILMD